MKIALLSRWYWEEHQRFGDEGGPTQQLAEAVAARGHEVIVLSQSPEARKLVRSRVGTLETWLSPRDKRGGLVMGWRDKLAKKTFQYRKLHTDAHVLRDFVAQCGPFDVLWAQTESPDGLIAGFARQLGFALPPILVQIQALRNRFERGEPVFSGKAPLMLAFRHAARVIANSEMVAGYLGAYTGPSLPADALAAKVRVVYPNLHRIFLQAAQEDPLEVRPRPDRVVFLGALNSGKGAMVFLKALPKTEMSKRSAVFALIGDFTEDNKAFVKRWEAQKEETRIQTLGARIEYLGKVSPSEVIRQIRLAQVVVVPSLFDAFNRGLAEALVLGRPVVTTDRVGAASLVHAHQSGVVVAPNDPDSLGHAIDAVASPLTPFAVNALKAAPKLLHEFTPEAVAEQMEYNLARAAGAIEQPAVLEPEPSYLEEEQEPLEHEPQEPEADESEPQEPEY
jgi:glycosyltransferase involved in cell wall biosynthesis